MPGQRTFRALRWEFLYRKALLAGQLAAVRKRYDRLSPPQEPESELPPGISVVIPSRNGRTLLERLLPRITDVSEIIVVDNGSDDGTQAFLERFWPLVRAEISEGPLSFARAVNRGIETSRYSHVCLLNNDMVPEPGFFRALREPFEHFPALFCTTAQIFFPPGKRREETGKAVIIPPAGREDATAFPVHCVEPVDGEDRTPVLYGSGGCSLYDTAKLRALGSMGEVYEPAYVEDLDIGVRGWQRGWPTVFVAEARTVHDHRATTSRYYTEEELAEVLERNYLRFLLRTIRNPAVFHELWEQAIKRLRLRAQREDDRAASAILREAWYLASTVLSDPAGDADEAEILALGSGRVAVFPRQSHNASARVVPVGKFCMPGPDEGDADIMQVLQTGAPDDSLLMTAAIRYARPTS